MFLAGASPRAELLCPGPVLWSGKNQVNNWSLNLATLQPWIEGHLLIQTWYQRQKNGYLASNIGADQSPNSQITPKFINS